MALAMLLIFLILLPEGPCQAAGEIETEELEIEVVMSNTDGGAPANDVGVQGSGGLPLFYKDVHPVEPNALSGYGLKKGNNFSFSAKANAVPVLFGELHMAQKHFPIIFAEGDPSMPLAVLGLQQEENLFVKEDGTWRDDTYIPLYIRRYPFILAETPTQNPDEKRMLLCVDKAAPNVVSQNPDMPFFNGQESTETIKNALEFCRYFQSEYVKTLAFVGDLAKHELLKKTDLKFDLADGNRVTAGSIVTIDHEKFEGLSDEVVLDLHKKNMLPLITLQISSQSNWQRIAFYKEKQGQAVG